LARLYDESSTLLYSLAMRMLGNRADAEEVVCDTYSRIWRESPRFDAGRGSAWTWIVLMCRSRCLDRLRSGTRQRTAEVTLPDADLEALPDAGWPSELEVTRHTVRQAMGVLDPEQVNLLRLAFFSGMTHSEISAHLRLPLGTVKTRIRTAMERLRHLLEGSPS
jgi:RNA polymerase sigma-70 factor (ECF subfamily)